MSSKEPLARIEEGKYYKSLQNITQVPTNSNLLCILFECIDILRMRCK